MDIEPSVSSFIACSYAQQCQELREYLKNLGAEISNQPSSKGMEDDLHKIIGVCDICFQQENLEEIESVLSGIVSVVVIIDAGSDSIDRLVLALCEKVAKSWEPNPKNGQIALNVLCLLFFSTNETSMIRYDVYYNMVEVAGKLGKIDTVFTNIQTMKKYFANRQPTPEQLQKLYRLLHQGLTDAGMSDDAYKVMLEMLATYTKENASQAREDAQRCIISSLADPNIYLLDHLLPLKPVKFLEGNPIHDLLMIAVYDKLNEYMKFYEDHKEYLQKIGLEHKKLMKKMQILTLLSMADKSSELQFSQIQAELRLEPQEVELFVIEALKTKLMTARIEQYSKKVLVKSVVKRAISRNHWLQIRDKLTEWKANIRNLRENIAEDVE